jgi:hypothetical protein
MVKICNYSSCNRKHKGHGLCAAHLYQKKKGWELRPISLKADAPIKDRLLVRTNQQENGCLLWTGSKLNNGYGIILVEGVAKTVHREAYKEFVGEIPEGLVIDHLCGNKLCIQTEHLRLATTKQNGENLTKLHSNNTSGYRGVWWNKRNNTWTASVKHNGKYHHKYNIIDIEEANAWAVAKRNELFTHNNLDK